jgi:uncharacterized protein (DUF302 family)
VSYGITITVAQPFDATVTAVREALSAQGFGVLTEIDLAATLEAKLGVQVPSQVILGACNPSLAYQALQAEPSVGLLLPCNVVVRSLADGEALVEALDPAVMVTVTGNEALASVADEAANRLRAVVLSLS